MSRAAAEVLTTRHGVAFSVEHVGAPATASAIDSILFVHATGLCKEVWDPVVTHLNRIGRACGRGAAAGRIDVSGHGGSRAVPADPRAWGEFLPRDILGVVDAWPGFRGAPARVCVGHSMGGCGALLAARDRPGAFTAVIGMEPIVYEAFVAPEALIAGAVARRASFASREEAGAYFRTKKFFARWDGAALQGYLTGGLVERPGGGGGLELACSPATEAGVFSGHCDLWGALPALRLPGACHVMAGADTHTFGAAHFADIAARLHATFEAVPHAGHMFPVERPDVAARAIARVLGWPALASM